MMSKTIKETRILDNGYLIQMSPFEKIDLVFCAIGLNRLSACPDFVVVTTIINRLIKSNYRLCCKISDDGRKHDHEIMPITLAGNSALRRSPAKQSFRLLMTKAFTY